MAVFSLEVVSLRVEDQVVVFLSVGSYKFSSVQSFYQSENVVAWRAVLIA